MLLRYMCVCYTNLLCLYCSYDFFATKGAFKVYFLSIPEQVEVHSRPNQPRGRQLMQQKVQFPPHDQETTSCDRT